MAKGTRQSGLRGLTLVELLVVITILLILAGVVLPMAQPALKGRAVREAARQVQVFLTSAQAKAIANQEFVGVQFRRDPLKDDLATESKWNHVNDISFQLTEVTLPAPLQFFSTPIFALPVSSTSNEPLPYLRDLVGFPPGTIEDWREKLRISGATIALGNYPQLFRVNTDLANVPPNFNDPAPEVIRIQLQSLTDNCNSSPAQLTLLPPSTSLPVKIYLGVREPRFTVAGSSDLPVGAYVDLSWSGTSDISVPPATWPRGKQGKFWDDGNPVTLLFGPDGSLQMVYGSMDVGVLVPPATEYRKTTSAAVPFPAPSVCSPFRPISDVYLLVSGAPKRMQRHLVNFRADSGSYWIIVSPSTGAISTTPNAGVDNSNEIPLDPSPQTKYLERWLFEMRSNSSKAL